MISHKGLPKFNPFKDILSGLIISCSSIHKLIAHAKTAGFASYRRISTAGLTLLLWGLTTGSMWLNFGVTAITALMTKSDLGVENNIKQHGEKEYVKLVASYLICAGLASIAMGVLGVGKIVNHVPKLTKIEFKWGCPFGVVLSVLPTGILTFGLSTVKSMVAIQQKLQDWIVTLTTAVTVANGALSTLKLLYISPNRSCWIPPLSSSSHPRQSSSRSVPPARKVFTTTAAVTLYFSQSSYAGGLVGEPPPIKVGIGLGPLSLPLEILNPSNLLQVPLVTYFGGIPNLLLSATLFVSLNFSA